MGKQSFDRRKNTLATLAVFFVIISMTASAVSAADEIQHPHKGGHHHPGGHHFHNWHDHHHHHLHDHYYNGIYYQDYEWVYNPTTLVWDWTYLPAAVVQPAVVVGQPTVVEVE